MDRFWTISFGLIVLVGAYTAWEHRTVERAHQQRVTRLSELIDRRDFQPTMPGENVRANFYRALHLLHESAGPPAQTLLWPAEPQDSQWYLERALEQSELDSYEGRLIRDSLHEALADLESAGALEDESNVLRLKDGEPPAALSGPFAQERLLIGHRVSPVLAPEAHNHWANFKLVPRLVWWIQPDRLDAAALSSARDLHEGGIISEETLQEIQSLWKKQSASS